jgi:hypothetical protein
MGSRSGELRYRADMASKPPSLGTAREWAIELAVGAGLGVFLGVIGPFGSFSNGGASPRILHFVACFLVGTTIFGLLQRLAADWARRTGVPVWLALVAAVVVGCGPLSIFVGWMITRIWPFMAGRLSPLDLYGQCLMLSAPVLLYMFFRQGVFKRTPPLPEAVEVSPDVQALSGEVICLRMEDHYVRVHTANGSRLVAGPFERVIAGLGDREGMKVHRSWWVSRAAVVGVEVDGRNLKLRLSNDLRAPVSRASVAKLRQVGWLPAET